MVHIKDCKTHLKYFYYEEGDSFIEVARMVCGQVDFHRTIVFDNQEAACDYFNTKCGNPESVHGFRQQTIFLHKDMRASSYRVRVCVGV